MLTLANLDYFNNSFTVALWDELRKKQKWE